MPIGTLPLVEPAVAVDRFPPAAEVGPRGHRPAAPDEVRAIAVLAAVAAR